MSLNCSGKECHCSKLYNIVETMEEGGLGNYSATYFVWFEVLRPNQQSCQEGQFT